jgi:DNA polymerase I-like protein with 3'-5' exonuclease and polymerase domains
MDRYELQEPSDVEIDILVNAELLALDIESKDPKLTTHGPGTMRGDGHVCGLAAGMDDGKKHLEFYLPITHPDTSAELREKNSRIFEALLSASHAKIGANFIYDIEWLEHEKYTVDKSELHDVQYAEPLLDEYKRSYSLNSLAKKYSSKLKKTNVLKDYNDMMGWKEKPIQNIWRMPARVAGEYAITDVTLPLEIFRKQKEALEAQNLWDIYRMEIDLIPLLLQMRRNGVRLDMPLLQRTVQDVTEKHWKLKERLMDWAGYTFNPGASGQLSKVFDDKYIEYPRNQPTELMKKAKKPGNPNLDKRALTHMAAQHDICNTILEYRHFDTMINMFLHPYLDFQVDGRLHGTLHPLRSDDYGTVAGRFSASKPNLQQVSAKKEEGEDDDLSVLKGQIIRSLFIPEEGMGWAKLDYSQVEYRIIAHYAIGNGAEELRRKYNEEPDTDMHQVITDLTGFDRRTTKRLNFGGTYGMGIPTAADTFGWTIQEATDFMNGYHQAAPYVKKSRSAVSRVAARRGYIFTVLGRKARTHPSRKLHSMFNRLIQGSAADVMKKGMVDAYKKGLFEVLIPHLTVHDEMDVSYELNKSGEDALKELTQTMEQAVKFDVPLLVDCHTGTNWAEAD